MIKMNLLKLISLFLLTMPLTWHPELCSTLGAETDPFTEIEGMQPNVEFWKKIYSQYSSRQGVLHDSKNLNIVYDVIELNDPDQPGGRRANRKRIKSAKSKYRSILQNLAQNGTSMPLKPDEQHVADMFSPSADRADFQQAVRRIRCQVGQMDRFRKGIIRSGAYLEEIREIFRSHRLPEDLAYLPHVESSFNPEAYSKFGAAGAWQFTRSTGRQYMTINYTLDERRDPIRASHAAARLLKKNYGRLGSWPLAITAYNHGLSGMLRAQKKHGNYQEVFKKYRSRTFKFASRNFYSEFLAARAVADNYQEYFGILPLDSPAETVDITLPGYTSIPRLAERLDLDMDTLRRLNPALRKPVFDGRKYAPKGYHLRLPVADGRDWEGLLASISEDIYKPDQKHSRLYRVDQGDTAGKIARSHGVSLHDLIAFNNLDNRATIIVGQNLRIPLPEEKTPVIASLNSLQLAKIDRKAQADIPTAAEGQMVPVKKSDRDTPPGKGVSPVPEIPMSAPVASPDAADAPPNDWNDDIAGLRRASLTSGAIRTSSPGPEPSGLTDTDIDSQPAVEVASHLGSENTLTQRPSTVVDGGQALTPVRGHEPDPDLVTGSISVEKVLQDNERSIGIIQVEIEETLGHYAEWSGVRASDIRRLNNMRYGHPIHLGQKLKIPLHRVTKEAFEETRFEYHKELVEDFFAAYRIEAVQLYAIKKGDNIWTLSREEFDLPLWLIQRYNDGVDLTSLVPSQNLRIPIVEKTI